MNCYPGNCIFVDNITCLQVERPENLSGGSLRVDENGCFSTNHLRTTDEYKVYQQVSNHVSLIYQSTYLCIQFCLVIGIVTIAVCIVGVLGNVASAVVLNSKDMKNCFNTIILALNVVDR